MTVTKLAVAGRLNNLNDFINALSYNRYSGGTMKKYNEKIIKQPFTEGQYDLNGGDKWIFIWHTCDRRRDLDNIGSAVKFILDSFQSLKFIKNDGYRNNRLLTHYYADDVPEKDYEYVEIIHCTELTEYIEQLEENIK